MSNLVGGTCLFSLVNFNGDGVGDESQCFFFDLVHGVGDESPCFFFDFVVVIQIFNLHKL